MKINFRIIAVCVAILSLSGVTLSHAEAKAHVVKKGDKSVGKKKAKNVAKKAVSKKQKEKKLEKKLQKKSEKKVEQKKVEKIEEPTIPTGPVVEKTRIIQ